MTNATLPPHASRIGNSTRNAVVLHSARVLAARSVWSIFFSKGVYILLGVAFLSGALILHNSLRAAERTLIYTATLPQIVPLLVISFLVATFLALLSALHIARERDRGTYEILLFGPVNAAAFILGEFLAQTIVFGMVVIATFVWINLVTWLLHLSYNLKIIVVLLQAIGMAAAVSGMGILTATLGQRTRSALVYLTLIIIFMVGIQAGDDVVSTMLAIGGQPGQALLFLRNALALVANIIEWVSPFAQMMLGVDALTNNDFLSVAAHLLITITQAFIYLSLAVILLDRKGARG